MGVFSELDLENQQINGLKQLPAKSDIPDCLKTLGFTAAPTADELKRRYRQIIKTAHPDNGGSQDYFIAIKRAYEEAGKLLEGE